jgi:predicted nucleic acid-binding protein
VKNFLDTSVLVATFYGDHEHHDESFALFRRQTRSESCTAAHCLVELYSVVTGMPAQDRASPDDALLFLQGIDDRLTIVALDETEYIGMLNDAAAANIQGGTCYDALIAQCALKAKAETIYTWNVKHFKRLGADVASRVRVPH